MKKKIIGILVCTLLIASGFASASIIKSETISVDNNLEYAQTSTLGETFLYPPWEHAGWVNEWSEGVGVSDGDAWGDEYEGNIYAFAGAIGAGQAQTECHYYHQTYFEQYVSSSAGSHDFTFSYSYDGDLNVYVFIFPPSNAQLYDEIKITFVVYVDKPEPHSFTKEVVLDEETRQENAYLTWDNTIDVSFNDIYVPEDTWVWFMARMDVVVYAAAGLLAGAEGTVNLHGSLNQIKIVDPNDPPSKPSKPSGPTGGAIRTLYTYTTSATDPDNDKVYYMWDWDAYGSHDYSNWLGPDPSGQQVSAKHSWDEQGTYWIRVKAKDIYDAESEWSDPLGPVIIPRNKQATNMLFLKWLEQFPLLTRLLGF